MTTTETKVVTCPFWCKDRDNQEDHAMDGDLICHLSRSIDIGLGLHRTGAANLRTCPSVSVYISMSEGSAANIEMEMWPDENARLTGRQAAAVQAAIGALLADLAESW